MCEDEWLMRNKICIFCRLPVRRTATKSAAASSGTGAGQLGHGGGMIFSYRSPRNKGLSALLAALRKEASVGAQVGAELSERERQSAAKKDAALLPLRGATTGIASSGLMGGPRKAHTATTQKSKRGKGKGGGGKLSGHAAKAKLQSLFTKYRGGTAQYALDDVSLASLLHMAALLFRHGDVLPSWVWELIQRVRAGALVFEGRSIAQTLSALWCVCCGVLQCVALQCVVLRNIVLRCIAVRCIALRCVALHCVALRCVALRCVALHGVCQLSSVPL